jgi:hypothetical protein
MKQTNKKILTVFLMVFILWACEEDTIGQDDLGTITGKVVVEGENTPLENVKITTNPVTNTVFTDVDGNYTLVEVEVGEYSVQADLDGYKTAFEAAKVVADRTVNAVIEMQNENVDNKVPEVPRLLFPADGAKSIQSPVQFSWSSSKNDDDETLYTLELRNGLTNETETFVKLTDTILSIDHLDIGANYFWQVTVSDGINDEVSSELSGFSTLNPVENRFLYVRNLDGNNVIFSGMPLAENAQENTNEVRLTDVGQNSFRPKKNPKNDRIAFLRTVGAETHVFSMDAKGTDLVQITSAQPILGFRPEELEFSWTSNGEHIYYPQFNKLYRIKSDGTGNTLVYTAPATEFISEVAVNPVNSFIALKTNDQFGYTARLYVVDPTDGSQKHMVQEGLPGAIGGIDYAADGNRVLFTYDVSANENDAYRQLDARIFEFDLTASERREILTKKPAGYNDLDVKYAPDDGAVIYISTSNDGVSKKDIYITGYNEIDQRTKYFIDGIMIEWH